MPLERDIGLLFGGVVLAVTGAAAAVALNTAPATPARPAVEVAANDPAAPATTSDGPLPAAVREVLDTASNDVVTALDEARLAEQVPPAVAEVLTQRGAVLTVPPDAEVTP